MILHGASPKRYKTWIKKNKLNYAKATYFELEYCVLIAVCVQNNE